MIIPGDDSSAHLLLSEMPVISRARDYHLYTRSGTRILDCYLDDGRALLGHRPGRPLLELKDVLSRGQIAGYPSIYSARLGVALEALRKRFGLPSGTFVARNQWSDAGAVDVWYPFQPGWLPTEESAIAPERGSLRKGIRLVVPFPGRMAPDLYLIPGTGRNDDLLSIVDPPLTPAIAAALCRTIYDLIAFDPPREWEAGYLDHHEVRKVVVAADRLDSTGTGLFHSHGPYLYCRCASDSYGTVFRRFLAGGILLNPRFPGPTILPIIWSKGERMQFSNIAGAVAREIADKAEGNGD